MKIGLVHDYLTQYGGAERTLETIAKIWPSAPVYTSIYDRKKLKEQGFSLQKNMVYESFMRKFPWKRKFAQSYYLPLYPLAFENFLLDEYEVVLSINSYASKAVITKPETLHICYCCTPPRHLWSFDDYIRHHNQVKRQHRFFLKPIISYLRLWDQVASSRVDQYLAISRSVKQRIEQFYQREAMVIYPPVEINKFKVKSQKSEIKETNFFLIVSRLASHKRVDLAITAFRNLPEKKLVIIGDGPMRKKYEKIASPNVFFKGRLTDMEMVGYYQNCEAFLYPQEEDFGITAVEAQAAGCPVIGYKKGGLLETIIEGRTGLFFPKQDIKSLVKVIKEFKKEQFVPQECYKNALRFSEERFIKEIKEYIAKQWEKYQKQL